MSLVDGRGLAAASRRSSYSGESVRAIVLLITLASVSRDFSRGKYGRPGWVTEPGAIGWRHYDILQRFLAGMTVHLVKLCVGCDTVQELKDWQTERLKRLKRAGKTPEHCHRTSQTPRRRDELLDGGSLYWVIKGVILVRQRVLDLRPDVKDDGTACCGIVLDPELVATRAPARS